MLVLPWQGRPKWVSHMAAEIGESIMTDFARETGIRVLAFARRVTLALIEEIPEAECLRQPLPGANHALWVAGHLASSDDFFLEQLGGKEPRCDAKFKALFGMGSTPTGSPGDYPPFEEIKEMLHERREALNAGFGSMSAEQLNEPLTGDYKDFAPNYGALMSTICWHEGIHAGQVTLIRRNLGIKPLFG